MKILVYENQIYNIGNLKDITVEYVEKWGESNNVISIDVNDTDNCFCYVDIKYRENLENKITNLIAKSIVNNSVTNLDKIIDKATNKYEFLGKIKRFINQY